MIIPSYKEKVAIVEALKMALERKPGLNSQDCLSLVVELTKDSLAAEFFAWRAEELQDFSTEEIIQNFEDESIEPGWGKTSQVDLSNAESEAEMVRLLRLDD